MKNLCRRAWKRGQTMTEYIIIIALIAIASIAIVTIFSNQIRQLFSGSAKQLSGDTSATVTDETGSADSKAHRTKMTDWQ